MLDQLPAPLSGDGDGAVESAIDAVVEPVMLVEAGLHLAQQHYRDAGSGADHRGAQIATAPDYQHIERMASRDPAYRSSGAQIEIG